jgi:hypothetical protein
MRHLICMVFCCIALLLAAGISFADTPIEMEFVNVTPPVNGCVCQPVDIEVKAQDWDITTSEAGWDDLIFHAYPLGSWTPLAAPERDQDGWWHQTFRKTFDAPGEYPSAEDEYVFRAIDLDIFHGENDPDGLDSEAWIATGVTVQDHYETGDDITCAIDAPANGAGYAPNAIVSCSATASETSGTHRGLCWSVWCLGLVLLQ